MLINQALKRISANNEQWNIFEFLVAKPVLEQNETLLRIQYNILQHSKSSALGIS